MTELKAWYRQEGETDIAYQAFKTWLELPPPRTLEALKQTGVSPASIGKWKTKNDWYSRAVAYDNDMSERAITVQLDHVVTLQQTVTAAALDDYARLRKTWVRTLKIIEDNMDDLEELWQRAVANGDFENASNLRNSIDGLIDQMNKVINARAKLEALGRTASHLPDRYGVKQVEDKDDDILPDVMSLTFNGPKPYVEE